LKELENVSPSKYRVEDNATIKKEPAYTIQGRYK